MRKKEKITPHDVDVSPVLHALDEIASFAEGCDDWVTIKIEIMQRLHPSLRRLFSTRDSITKEQSLNDFERDLVERYKQKTGIDLIVRTREERREIYGKI